MAQHCSEGLTTSIDVGGEEVIRRVSDAWQGLCDETNCSPFHWPQWIATYVRVFEPRSQVILLTAWAAGKLAAVLPLIRKHGWYAGVPVVKLSGAANVHSVLFDITRADGPAGDAAIQALWSRLKHTAGWQIAEFPTFPADGACHKLIQCAGEDGYRSFISPSHNVPILRMRDNGNGQLDWLAGTSRHFRHELRRYARLLDTQMGGQTTLVHWTEPRPDIVRRFYALEAAGWKGKNGSAIDCEAATRAFYDQIAQETASRGRFCLHLLESNGHLAAGAFSIMTGRCFFPLKIAYDEALHRAGPGHVLFNGILKECAERGITELYFGGNQDRFKTEWTSEALPHFNGFIFGRDFRAQLAHGIRTNLLSRLGKIRKSIRIACGQST